jgi:hypothetical protein
MIIQICIGDLSGNVLYLQREGSHSIRPYQITNDSLTLSQSGLHFMRQELRVVSYWEMIMNFSETFVLLKRSEVGVHVTIVSFVEELTKSVGRDILNTDADCAFLRAKDDLESAHQCSMCFRQLYSGWAPGH